MEFGFLGYRFRRTASIVQIRSKITNHSRNSLIRELDQSILGMSSETNPYMDQDEKLTGGDHGLDAQVLRHLDRDLGGLQRQLSSRHNNHGRSGRYVTGR